MGVRGGNGRSAVEVSVRDVIGFRLRGHHLTHRQPADSLLAVAGACAVQNSPPGSTLLALHARVDNVTRNRLDHLVGEEKSLLQTWCMRGAPFLFPTLDAPVFTTGVLPTTETARLHLIAGVEQALTTLGMGLDETVDLAAAQIGNVLSQRRLAIDELGEQLAERIAGELSATQRTTWQATGPYGANQPLGEAVVHFCIRILSLRGLVCMAPRTRNKAPFVLLEEWLGHRLPEVDPESVRTALLRRYLHCYGPSTRKDFAAWLGVYAGDVNPWWTSLAAKLTPVDVDGRRAWICTEDLDTLQSPVESHGVRLLPPGDPYTQMRDRDTIVDRSHQPAVWKPVGAPGAVLADGRTIGTWRPHKSGMTLTLVVNLFRSLDTTLRKQVHEEAERVAELRDASSVQVDFEDGAG